MEKLIPISKNEKAAIIARHGMVHMTEGDPMAMNSPELPHSKTHIKKMFFVVPYKGRPATCFLLIPVKKKWRKHKRYAFNGVQD